MINRMTRHDPIEVFLILMIRVWSQKNFNLLTTGGVGTQNVGDSGDSRASFEPC